MRWAWLLIALWSAAAQGASARIALRWKAVPGAAAYELQIARDATFRHLVLTEKTEVAGYRWNELPNVAYYWRVRSVDAEGRTGEWSRTERIAPQVGAPVAKAPEERGVVPLSGAVAKVTLEAEASALFKTFFFDLARDARFTAELQTQKVQRPEATFELPAPGTWYWRVRGVDLAGRDTDASEVRRVEVRLAPPRPVHPAEGAEVAVTGADATSPLSWEPSVHAKSYLVELRREGDRPITLRAHDNSLNVALPVAGTWTFKVAAVDRSGRKTALGAPRTFVARLTPARLVTPAPGEVLRRRDLSSPIDLSWELPAGTVGAQVQLARGDFAQPLQELRAEGASAAITVAEEGTYQWRVIAFDAQGQSALASEPGTFTVKLPVPLAAPTALTPGADAVIAGAHPVTLSWNGVEGATGYEVELGTTVRRAADPSLPLRALEEGEHTWRVRALDDLQSPGHWSAPARFHLGVPATARAEVSFERDALIADGEAHTRVAIALYDLRGRKVEGASPHVETASGVLEEVRVEAGAIRARYIAPDSVPEGQQDELVVRDRGFEARAQIRILPRPSSVVVGAAAGYSTAFSSFASPYAGAFVTWNTPWLRERLAFSARAGFHQGQASVMGGTFDPVSFTTRVVPLTALALYRLPLGPVELNAGAGPSLHVVSTSATFGAEVVPTAGVAAAVEAVREVGPGVLSVGLTGEYVRVDGELVRGRTGGLRASIGYGVKL